LTIRACPPDALLRLELWRSRADADLPAAGRADETAHGRLMWIEPRAWLLRTELDNLARAQAWLESLAGDDGAVIDITGGLARFRLVGPAWRELLTVNAVFDVEDAGFAPACVAATLLNHASIWIDVVTPNEADVYCLPSFAEHLFHGWSRALARMG
jgi:heterotetrameric sarcosine oxidase gamma subunit